MRIEQLFFKDFSPLGEGSIDFPETASGTSEVHFFTGQNGTGKTRLLCLLASALGNSDPLLQRHENSFMPDYMVLADVDHNRFSYLHEKKKSHHKGFAPLSRNSSITNIKPFERAVQESVYRNNEFIQNRAEKTQIASKYIAFAVKGSSRITEIEIEPTKPLRNLSQTSLLSFEDPGQYNDILFQSLSNLLYFSMLELYNSIPESEKRATTLIKRLERAIESITGSSFIFKPVKISDKTKLFFVWGNVEMPFASLPDGLKAILGWLAMCIACLNANYETDKDIFDKKIIMLIDEPEMHLHPGWQRKIIKATQILFPNSQLFIATHSPFIISSVNEGWIHCLRKNVNGWFDPETEELLKNLRAMRLEVAKDFSKYEDFKAKATEIAKRSDLLTNMMNGELRQMERNLKERGHTVA
jgi:predicted ATPase